MTAQADAQPALSGSDDHRQRVGDPQQLAPQTLLARLHHRAVLVAAVDLCLELLHTEVVCQCPGDYLRRDGRAIYPFKVQCTGASALLIGHFAHSTLRSRTSISVTERKIEKRAATRHRCRFVGQSNTDRLAESWRGEMRNRPRHPVHW